MVCVCWPLGLPSGRGEGGRLSVLRCLPSLGCAVWQHGKKPAAFAARVRTPPPGRAWGWFPGGAPTTCQEECRKLALKKPLLVTLTDATGSRAVRKDSPAQWLGRGSRETSPSSSPAFLGDPKDCDLSDLTGLVESAALGSSFCKSWLCGNRSTCARNPGPRLSALSLHSVTVTMSSVQPRYRDAPLA